MDKIIVKNILTVSVRTIVPTLQYQGEIRGNDEAFFDLQWTVVFNVPIDQMEALCSQSDGSPDSLAVISSYYSFELAGFNKEADPGFTDELEQMLFSPVFMAIGLSIDKEKKQGMVTEDSFLIPLIAEEEKHQFSGPDDIMTYVMNLNLSKE